MKKFLTCVAALMAVESVSFGADPLVENELKCIGSRYDYIKVRSQSGFKGSFFFPIAPIGEKVFIVTPDGHYYLGNTYLNRPEAKEYRSDGTNYFRTFVLEKTGEKLKLKFSKILMKYPEKDQLVVSEAEADSLKPLMIKLNEVQTAPPSAIEALKALSSAKIHASAWDVDQLFKMGELNETFYKIYLADARDCEKSGAGNLSELKQALKNYEDYKNDMPDDIILNGAN